MIKGVCVCDQGFLWVIKGNQGGVFDQRCVLINGVQCI